MITSSPAVPSVGIISSTKADVEDGPGLATKPLRSARKKKNGRRREVSIAEGLCYSLHEDCEGKIASSLFYSLTL
jgi:hypothetical protein